MRRDRLNTIVPIGNGLCRVVVRSEKLARQLATIPGVQLREENATELGWWLVFPEELRKMIEPVFVRKDVAQGGKTRVEQASLIDELHDHPEGDMIWAAERGDSIETDADDETSDTDDTPAESGDGEDSTR
jgi:hypothetical protein